MIASSMTDGGTVCIMHTTSKTGASIPSFGATVSDQVPKLSRMQACNLQLAGL